MKTAFFALTVSLASLAAADTYVLQPGTRIEDGCRPPCMCPFLFIGDVEGTFELTLIDRDPLFDTYEISDIRWAAPTLGLTFTGRGVYRIGGEVAITHFLTLDLASSGGRDYRLESRDPRPVVWFPDIRINADNRVGEGCNYAEVFLNASPFCPADFNSDGGVDGADVRDFFDAWARGLPRADINGDGGVDGADVEAFYVVWEAGGC